MIFMFTRTCFLNLSFRNVSICLFFLPIVFIVYLYCCGSGLLEPIPSLCEMIVAYEQCRCFSLKRIAEIELTRSETGCPCSSIIARQLTDYLSLDLQTSSTYAIKLLSLFCPSTMLQINYFVLNLFG